jgi:phosphate transport system protein
MRNLYHDQLDEVGELVVMTTNAVAVAMERATAALLDANLVLAEQVMTADIQIDLLREQINERCFALIATQSPVATDLRVLIGTINLTGDLERMGDLARHVAKIARLRYPEIAVPAEVRDTFAQMGKVAQSLIGKVAGVVTGRDVELARAVATEDDSMDALRRKLFTIVLSNNWAHGQGPAIDVALLGRYYERYADHAVTVARHVTFVVTGANPHEDG